MARERLVVFGSGAASAILGSLIGLDGAEFRLPVLVGLFGMARRWFPGRVACPGHGNFTGCILSKGSVDPDHLPAPRR